MVQPVDATTERAPAPLALRMAAGLFILVAISVASMAVGHAIARAWDPCAWFAAILLGVGGTAAAAAEYFAVFRQSKAATTMMAVLSGLVAAFMLFALVTTALEFLIKDQQFPPWPLAVFFIGIGGAAGASGLLHFRALARFRNLPADNRPRYQVSLREMVGLTAVCCLALGMAVTVFNQVLPRVAEHVEMDDPPFGIPKGARDICWQQGFRGTMSYEFTLDETSFRKWVNEELIDTTPLSQQPTTIQPITPASPYSAYTYRVRPGITDALGEVMITNGLLFSWSEEDRGIHAAFDRATNRVYYFQHFH